jgi:hypothetical protein
VYNRPEPDEPQSFVPRDELEERETYRAPVLHRHGSLQRLTRGSNIGAPEDLFSATTAGT